MIHAIVIIEPLLEFRVDRSSVSRYERSALNLKHIIIIVVLCFDLRSADTLLLCISLGVAGLLLLFLLLS